MNTTQKRWKPDEEKAWKAFYLRAQKDGLIPEGSVGQIAINIHPKEKSRYYVRWSVAAVLCALCIGVAMMTLRLPGSSVDMITVYNTNQSELRVLTLSDGSSVYLAGGSRITYPQSFASDQRQVVLDGEAFFEVKQDPLHPFRIETKYILIEVLGTAFRVRSGYERNFELSVESGVVKVSLKEENQDVFVEAGEKVQLASNWLQKSYVDDPPGLFAGDARKLYFKDESLEHIIRVVNERSDGATRIVLEGESLWNKKITVTLESGNIEQVADLICNALNLRKTVEGNTVCISEK